MTFSNFNVQTEQCALLRTFCLYLFGYPYSLLH